MRVRKSLAAGILLGFAVLALAGCADGPQRFPATDASAEARSAAVVPGVTVTARLTGGGDEVVVHAHAVNEGPRAWRVPAHCSDEGFAATEPWSIAARYPDDPQSTRDDYGAGARFPIYPARGCVDVVLRDFPPGAELDFTVPWNGSFYSPHFEDFVEVLPGGYLVDVALEVYGEDGDAVPLVATLSVRVLDTDG